MHAHVGWCACVRGKIENNFLFLKTKIYIYIYIFLKEEKEIIFIHLLVGFNYFHLFFRVILKNNYINIKNN